MNAMHWPPWLGTAPSLVAESLREIADPLAAWLRVGPARPAPRVAAALARAMLPDEAQDAPPPWLRADQTLSFQRAVAAARRFGGAILADPVGTGKTYIGIAAALALSPSRPVHVLVPAALRQQWADAGRKSGAPFRVTTHETLSRGRAPDPGEPGPVIIDESHRFRNPATRRYRTLAPWLLGRKGILLTATPAVNGISDVAHQLLLLVRDDALAGFGLSSLRSLAGRTSIAALSRVILTGEDRTGHRPARTSTTLRSPADPEEGRALEAIDGLALSRDPSVASLVRISLLSALASSPAALGTALRRYRNLLRHAAEARAAGRALDRAALRRVVRAMTDQLVMWGLFDDQGDVGELALDDLERLGPLVSLADAWLERGDARSARLGELLKGDRRRTIVFSTARATIAQLRDRLDGSGTAWCTGSAAGIGHHRMEREDVLSWFRNGSSTSSVLTGPNVLITTDVSAEGLDLSRVERVIHYDLPWTDVRLTQREGRALRLGARHDLVEVVRFLPGTRLEMHLRRAARIAAKSGLPIALGLNQEPSAPWRASAQLAERFRSAVAEEGVAALAGVNEAAIVGFRVHGASGEVWPTVLARENGEWKEDAASLARIFDCVQSVERAPPEPGEVRRILGEISPRIREALRAANRVGTTQADGATAQALRRRMQGLARRMAQQRDLQSLAALDRGLRMLTRGRTAGEEARLAAWMELPDRELMHTLRALVPDEPARAPVAVSLIGVLVFGPPSSLASNRLHRIHASGAPRRNECGRGAGHDEQNRESDVGNGIGGLDPKEHRLHQAGEPERKTQADAEAQRQQDYAAMDYQREDGPRFGAQRHADADLPGAPADLPANQRVDPDARDGERRGGEGDQHAAGEALADGGQPHPLRERSDVVDGDATVHLTNRGTHGRGDLAGSEP
jgi:hypothetical protein